LRALAAARGVTLRYEASVASAVPIINTLDHALAGDEIVEIGGVLNGTCNFILGKMRDGNPFGEALAQAQAAGYAEADPRNDVQGIDAAHKLAILVQHAFGLPVITPHIRHRGIAGITSASVRRARQHGYELKLVGYARVVRQAHHDEQYAAESIVADVGPVLVPFTHPFAKVSGVENIVRVVGASAGPLLFSGAGAGREAASSAVLGDVVAALRVIAERHHTRAVAADAQQTPYVDSAFDRFPAFAGFPVLTSLSKGDTHVGYSPRTLSAV
jgi:homoserine dehydrogenase